MITGPRVFFFFPCFCFKSETGGRAQTSMAIGNGQILRPATTELKGEIEGDRSRESSFVINFSMKSPYLDCLSRILQ